ncbi:hypothetical protein BCR36DRAFT_406761 [Piromyces finnis]|uniref:Formin GTPase-binding domain-containing protein n=1 Tax=Piromyces finnis TaxID=1754191 RepID=A0A1Y1UY93_9FUNG|nr:hypothetical protein BCR36DRAFT_406761 [Piromyces finnis]|eukprot:ORX43397.1 hypothetical protein BCR36DRAFT_406761 [Piromyces finnis]
MFNNENNNESNTKLSHHVFQINRKEPNFDHSKGNTKYVKKDMNINIDDDDDEINNYTNDTSSSYSISAFDSLKNYRKSVSPGNSRSSVKINYKDNYDFNYNNDNSSNNKNMNISNDENHIYHESTSNNSIPLSDNFINENENEKIYIQDNKNMENNKENDIEYKINLSNEKFRVIPRNNNDEEQFNELYINKAYILKKFDKMMDDLGLTTEGRMTLMNLSLEKKWEIFRMQKDKINNECNNPNINSSSYDNSPKYFINLLKKNSINTKMLTKLRFMISDDSSNWLTNFIKLGGYYYLNKNIMEIVIKDIKCSKDWINHENLVRCIRGFFHSRIGLETLYSDPTPLLLITLSLFYHQLIHLKKNVNYDNSVQSIFLSSSTVLPLSNRVLILDMLSYLTKIETPLGWNMVLDAMHWVSLGNGNKIVYLEDIKNRLLLSKEKFKQNIHSKKNLKKGTLKSFNFSSLSIIPKNLLKQTSFISQKGKTLKGINDKNKFNKEITNSQSFISNSSNVSNLDLTFSEMFTDEFSYHLAFTLLQEEYQLQGYQDFNKESIGFYQKLNSQSNSSDISSYNQESNITSLEDLSHDDYYTKQNSSLLKQHQAELTLPRNRKINIFSQNNNESNLIDASSSLSVPNLTIKKQPIKENSYNENDTSSNNSDYLNSQYTMNSESTIANNSLNYLSSNVSLNDTESELKKYNIKYQHQIKKVQVNQSAYNSINDNNKNLYANVPKFCPFTFWMKDFEECAKEYNQLFLGNNLSSKIIYNTIANKTYRWTPMMATTKEAVSQEQAINYICSNLHLLLSILNNVPEQTAQNRLAIIKCLKLCRIDKIFQKLSQSKNTDVLNLINLCIKKDLAKNLEDFSLSIFQMKDHYNLYGTSSIKSISKNKDYNGIKNLSRKILVKKKKHASMNNIIDNCDFDKNSCNINEGYTIINQDMDLNEMKSNTFSFGDRSKLFSIQNDKNRLNSIKYNSESYNKIASSINTLNVTDSYESVSSEIDSSHLSLAHKSQVIGRSSARKIKI